MKKEIRQSLDFHILTCSDTYLEMLDALQA